MIIAIDFDGTCVTPEFPKVGKDIGAAPVLKELIKNGHKLILFTMRSNIAKPISNDSEIYCQGGNYLNDALNWFKKNDIELWGIQTNPDQRTWTTSPKAYAQLYIDDAALGCPLLYDEINEDGYSCFERPHVYWNAVRNLLIDSGIINTKLK